MENRKHITEEERNKCRKVMEAYAELYEKADVIVVDTGRYGFTKLQYFKSPNGFEVTKTFAKSEDLFEDLWEEWFAAQIFSWVENTPMQEMEYKDIFKNLPEKKKKELMDKRNYFAEKSEIARIVKIC